MTERDLMEQQALDAMTIDGDRFVIVVNTRNQHAIWPAAQPLPEGWANTGFSGDADACMARVDAVWPRIV